MSKIAAKKLTGSQRVHLQQEVSTLFGQLGLTHSGKLLLSDMLTDSEVVMFARRIRISRLLLRGSTFQSIADQLRVGLTTIRQVHACLESTFPDYQCFVFQLAETEDRPVAELCAPLSTAGLKLLRQRYPQTADLFHALIGS